MSSAPLEGDLTPPPFPDSAESEAKFLYLCDDISVINLLDDKELHHLNLECFYVQGDSVLSTEILKLRQETKITLKLKTRLV